MGTAFTERQKVFIGEYLKHLNATKAAISAGYSERTADQQGSRLLANVKIATEIARRQAQRFEKLEISADWVLQELRKIAGANMLDYMAVSGEGTSFDLDFSKLTREQAAAIQEITVDTTGGGGDGERRLVVRNKFKLASKLDALELLGKHLELFTERVKVTGLEGLADAIAEARKRAAKR